MPSLRLRYAVLLLRRLWKFILGYLVLFLLASFGFFLLEAPRFTLLDSFYWAMVTLSTIGYGDIVPTDDYAKVFVIGIAASEVFLAAYLISVVIAVVQEESQHRLLGTLGTDLSDHIVVLGYGNVGRAAVRELLAQDEKVAVVSERAEDVPVLHALAGEKRLFATYGPLADQEILKRVNIADAHSVIVASTDDTASLVAALNARALNPKVRIVVSVSRPELKQTLKAAGVTYVASPGDMGGRLCADAAFRPEVANAVEDLTSTELGADLEEFVLTDRTPVSNQALRDAERLVRDASDCLVIGYARPGADGEFATVMNPPSTFRFQPGDALLVLGTVPNLHRLQKWIGVPQGR
ncbi:MAG TPA: NAD-binding protein [Thermoplasmata archaeon]|nr:NAD-binding protein [Thermoplasmata archaeon]